MASGDPFSANIRAISVPISSLLHFVYSFGCQRYRHVAVCMGQTAHLVSDDFQVLDGVLDLDSEVALV